MNPKYFEGHTPGTWFALNRGQDIRNWFVCTNERNPMSIAEVESFPAGMDNASANAHLMAAAPELVAENAELLRQRDMLLDLLKQRSTIRIRLLSDHPDDWDRQDKYEEAVLAAIAECEKENE